MKTALKILFLTLVTITVSAQSGEKLFEEHCSACHLTTKPMTGPPLAFISDYKDFEWFYDFKKNPVSYYKTDKDKYTSNMLDYWYRMSGIDPPVELSKEELRQIWDFLKDLKSTSVRHAKTDSLR